MGGGDLNLKKSWHPHTMKNQEKVWKAEQQKKEEEIKLHELRKEIEQERNREDLKRHGETSGVLSKKDEGNKMDWMYKNNAQLINREEYLLGRKIDKSFEILQEEEKQKEDTILGVQKPINHVEHECIPFSIRSYRNANTMEQVDLQRKRMEDPLLLIKEKEMESRRKLLENPVRLKEIHRMLKEELQTKSDKVKKGKKSKKSKKSKKKHKHHTKFDSSNSFNTDNTLTVDSEGSDLDERLAKKYKKLKSSLQTQNDDFKDFDISKLINNKFETISRELDKIVGAHNNNHEMMSKRNAMSEYHSLKEKDKGPSITSYSKKKGDIHSDRSRYPHHKRKENHFDRKSNSDSPRRLSPRNDHNMYNYKSRPPAYGSNRPMRHDRNSVKDQFNNSKLSEVEKEARRREMMENAAWRESDRAKAVQTHRDAYALEESMNTGRDFDKEFINKQVKEAIKSQTSIGSRIRSNLNNIQRHSSAMSSNFVRK